MPAEGEPVAAQLRHQAPGRIRAELSAPLPARERLERLATDLAALPQVTAAEIRPGSGSVIMRHQGDPDSLPDRLAEAGLRLTDTPNAAPDAPIDPIGTSISLLSRADRAIAAASDGRLDIWGAAFGLLVAAGMVQLARGRIAGPALALFGQAATLALARPLRNFIR